jgi:hypothetical protein
VNHPTLEQKKKLIMILVHTKIPKTNSIKLRLPTASSQMKMETLNKTLNSGKEKLVMPNRKKLLNSNKKMTNTEQLLQLLRILTIIKMLSTKPKSTDLKVMLKTNKPKSED